MNNLIWLSNNIKLSHKFIVNTTLLFNDVKSINLKSTNINLYIQNVADAI